jgi:hypothetical protein
LVEAACPACATAGSPGAVGDGQHKDLATSLGAIKQDQELGDDRDLVLGTSGGAGWGNRVDLIK